ncbi:phage tail tape measure protein [Clostridium luticellarii]|uniref:Phage-related minor tail protein n=1 Tax=Clostridium luticellarii TaxID=1691940 RepID=A0A2T0BLK1_9CLOT|nr:phage tail tape measure protein [Clostridium luticellarii]PRR84739.1 Phage-related minor tail protein [Clostridium luticellarii]
MAIDGGTILATLALTTSPFNASLASAGKSLRTFADSAQTVNTRIGALGNAANAIGSSLSKYVTLPILGIGAAALKMSTQFDAQMSRVQSVAGASASQMKALHDQALELGASTAFSASEAAEGMENLASAGFTVNEITKAMPGMLDLAAASGEDLANSADIAASTLRGFGLAADQAGHVADVLAKNANATNAAVADTGEAMKYVAPVAHSMGLSLEEVTAAIGEMADQGIKGSQAGTTIRSALISLAKPSKQAAELMQSIGFSAFDAQGKMLPLNQIVANLQKSMAGMTQEQKANTLATIFGTEAMSGMQILVNDGSTSLQKLTKELQNSTGAAADAAKINQDNLKGSLDGLSGAFETLGIKIGETATPQLRGLVDWFAKVVTAFGNSSDGTRTFIVETGLAVAAIGPLLLVLSQLILSLQRLNEAYQFLMRFQAMQSIMNGVRGAMAGLLSPISLTIGALALLGIGIYEAATHWQYLRGVMANVDRYIHEDLTKDLKYAYETVVMITKNIVQWLQDNLPGIINTVITVGGQIFQYLSEHAGQFLTVAKQIVFNIANGIITNLPQMIAAASNIINTLMTSFLNSLPTLMLMGQQLLQNILNGINTYLPNILTTGLNIITQLINSIVVNLPYIINIGSQVIITLLTAIIQALPILISGAANIISALIIGIINVLPMLINVGLQLVLALANAILQNLPQIITAGMNLIVALINGILQNLPQIIATIVEVIVLLAQAIIQNLPLILSAGIRIIGAIIIGLGQALPQLLSYGGQAMHQLWNILKNVDWAAVGKAVINGIIAGIKAIAKNLWDTAKWLGEQLLTKLRETFGIGSPSKEMYSIGKYLIQGLANAMTDGKDHIMSVVNKVFGGALSYAKGMFSSAQVGAWLSMALMESGTPLSWLPAMQQLVKKESGGNPGAYNSTSVGGQHATGLMQMLPSTFRAYMASGHGNITNPLDNILSAINYIKARYGSPYNIPHLFGGNYVGYATGIKSAVKGMHAVAEKGLEVIGGKALRYFSGGQTVLNNRDSMNLLTTVANITDALNNAKGLDTITQAQLATPNGTPVSIELNLNGNYAFTDKAAIDELSTQVSRTIGGRMRGRF